MTDGEVEHPLVAFAVWYWIQANLCLLMVALIAGSARMQSDPLSSSAPVGGALGFFVLSACGTWGHLDGSDPATEWRSFRGR